MEKAGDKVTCPRSQSRPGTEPVSPLPLLIGQIFLSPLAELPSLPLLLSHE